MWLHLHSQNLSQRHLLKKPCWAANFPHVSNTMEIQKPIFNIVVPTTIWKNDGGHPGNKANSYRL